MARTKAERLAAVHEAAMSQFDIIQTALRDERLQCLQDRRFYSVAGAQWEGPLGVQFENKPKFEVNKVHLSVIRIFNEYRNNRIDVKFVSKDGEDNEALADTCSSLYRSDEQDSGAQEAYDNAFEEGVGGGFGAWRLRAAYEDDEDDEDERQRIRIEPIFDADSSVFFDLDAKRQDKADAKFCFVLTSLTKDAFEEEYGELPSTIQKQVHQSQFDWLTPDIVYIAEYYVVEEKSETVHVYRGLTGEERRVRDSELSDDPELEKTLAATGFKEVRQKKTKKKKVHKYILSGHGVLEDAGYIAGKHIPIVPFFGKRWFVDNIERCMGHVRLAKDSQRLANMQRSKLGEYAAYSSIKKPVFVPEQISGHQMMWAEDNIRNYPYLLINALTDLNGNTQVVGPAAYTEAPEIPPAMAALLQICEQDMQDVLGKQEQGEQIKSNISGKAIELIQQQLGMQTFIYVSNFAKAIKRSGEIWLSMAKELMVEDGRKMKGIGANGETKQIELNRPVMNQETGAIEAENDLSEADFDIAVEVGPSSQSKKQAIVNSLTSMMAVTQDPEVAQVLGAMALMNMEGEGIGDIREYFRHKLVTMGVMKPTDEEAQQMAAQAANTQPDPNTVFLQASAEQAQAQAVKARADTVLTIAKAKETQAKTAQTLSDIDLSHRQQLLDTVQALGQALPAGEMPAPAQVAPAETAQPLPPGESTGM